MAQLNCANFICNPLFGATLTFLSLILTNYGNKGRSWANVYDTDKLDDLGASYLAPCLILAEWWLILC